MEHVTIRINKERYSVNSEDYQRVIGLIQPYADKRKTEINHIAERFKGVIANVFNEDVALFNETSRRHPIPDMKQSLICMMHEVGIHEEEIADYLGVNRVAVLFHLGRKNDLLSIGDKEYTRRLNRIKEYIVNQKKDAYKSV